MGENEQGGMLRVVVVVGLVALIASVIIGGVVTSKANMNKHINNTSSLVEKQANAVSSRNLILNSSGMNASETNRPGMRPNGADTRNYYSTIAYNPDSITLTYTGNGTQEWYYAIAENWQTYDSAKLDKTKQYTISVDVKGTVPSAAFRVNNVYSPSVSINNKTWTRLTYTFTFAVMTGDYADKYYIRLNAMNGSTNGNFVPGQTLSFRNFKLEAGNKATDWTPASED